MSFTSLRPFPRPAGCHPGAGEASPTQGCSHLPGHPRGPCLSSAPHSLSGLLTSTFCSWAHSLPSALSSFLSRGQGTGLRMSVWVLARGEHHCGRGSSESVAQGLMHRPCLGNGFLVWSSEEASMARVGGWSQKVWPAGCLRFSVLSRQACRPGVCSSSCGPWC